MAEWFEPKPTIDEMRAWISQLRSEFESLGTDQEMEENIYFQRFSVFAPEVQQGKTQPVGAVKTGSAPADADAMMDSLVPPKIQITVRPRKSRKKYKDQAIKLQLAAAAILELWRRIEDVLNMIAADMVIRRVGVARVMYDENLWPPYPAEFEKEPLRNLNESDAEYDGRLAQFEDAREDWEDSNRLRFPITLERRNPRTTAWRIHRGEILVVVERYQTTALEALQAFRGYPKAVSYLDQFREALGQAVTVEEVWYGRYRSMFLDSVDIFEDDGVLEHGYSSIPYLIAPFRELPFDEPNLRYRGGLTNAANLYPLESNVLTMHVAILAWNAWRTWIGWTSDGRDFDVIPGQYIPIDQRKQEYLQMLEGDAVPPELLQTSATVDQYVQRNGVAQGPRTAEGTRSGQQLWAIQAMRAIKIERAKAALSDMVGRALGLALQQIEHNVREPLTIPTAAKDAEGDDIGQVEIGPKDIQGYWDGVRVNFVQRMDPAILEQAKALMALEQNSFMPWWHAVEMSGMTDNPQEWDDRMHIEKTERSQVMIDLASFMRMREWLDPDNAEDQIILQRLQDKLLGGQGGGGGGGGQPGGQKPMMQPTNPNKGGGAPGGGGGGDAASQLAQAWATHGRGAGRGGGPSRGGGGRSGGGAAGGAGG